MKAKSISIKVLCAVFALMLAAAVALSGCGASTGSTTQATQKVTVAPATTPVVTAAASKDVDKSDPVKVVMKVKDYGEIKLNLYPHVAPETVANFSKLVEEKFYDGLTFHRIMEGFMIQGGDPRGNGTGGSDELIKGEFASNGFENNLSHTRGVISMARSSDPDSASSQFFIVHADSTFLDGQYAAFGEVTEGMDVVDKIAKDANPTDDNGSILHADQPVIESVRLDK